MSNLENEAAMDNASYLLYISIYEKLSVHNGASVAINYFERFLANWAKT